MRQSTRYALRFLVIVAAIGALSTFLTPPPTAFSPYVSGLSTASFGTDLFAKPCPKTFCKFNTACAHTTLNLNCGPVGGDCGNPC